MLARAAGDHAPAGRGSPILALRAAVDSKSMDNSNNWAARALRAAGCPIDPTEAITAGAAMHRAARFGRVIRPGRLWTGAAVDVPEGTPCRVEEPAT